MKVKWQSDAPNMELKVPSEIKIDGYIPTDEDLTFTGDCPNLFADNKFNWLLEHYTSKLQFNNITDLEKAFQNTTIKNDISNLTFNLSKKCEISYMFGYSNLSSYPQIKGEVLSLSAMFYQCKNGAAIPENFFNDLTFPKDIQISCNGIFQYCKNIIKPPSLEVFKKLNLTKTPSWHYTNFYYSLFEGSDIQEVRNLPVVYSQSGLNNNMFVSTVKASKLSIFTFEPNQTALYQNQTLNLSEAGSKNQWSDSDILKSVYNHTSAVETINSLPDTSAYLEEKGGTNTILFFRIQGGNTEGGAIGNLTAEEIAMAAAKGWTVAFK